MLKTRNKFNEAKHFYEQMDEYHLVDVDKFQHSMNAFITSSRAIIWNLKKEMSDLSLLHLYEEADISDYHNNADSIISEITELRNVSEKKESIKVHGKTIEYEFDLIDTKGEFVKLEPNREFYSAKSEIGTYETLDIMELGRDYLLLYSKLLNSIESKIASVMIMDSDE